MNQLHKLVVALGAWNIHRRVDTNERMNSVKRIKKNTYLTGKKHEKGKGIGE